MLMPLMVNKMEMENPIIFVSSLKNIYGRRIQASVAQKSTFISVIIQFGHFCKHWGLNADNLASSNSSYAAPYV